MTREQVYENARKNSVGEEKRCRKISMSKAAYQSKIKRAFITGCVIATLGVSSLVAGGNALVNQVQNAQVYSEYTADGAKMVRDNTKRTSDNEHYYYDCVDIASELKADPENYDINLFGIYSAIDYDVLTQMDDIVRISSGGQSNFEDYYTENGYVKEDGSFDSKAYRDAMHDLILKTNAAKEAEEALSEAKGL